MTIVIHHTNEMVLILTEQDVLLSLTRICAHNDETILGTTALLSFILPFYNPSIMIKLKAAT